MNAYKVNETGFLFNGTQTIANYSARAIFSSTIRYILLPIDLQPVIVGYLLYDKMNSTVNRPLFDQDGSGSGLYFWWATCNTSAYQSLWLRLNDTWFEI